MSPGTPGIRAHCVRYIFVYTPAAAAVRALNKHGPYANARGAAASPVTAYYYYSA